MEFNRQGVRWSIDLPHTEFTTPGAASPRLGLGQGFSDAVSSGQSI
jgi:hypothetical protein